LDQIPRALLDESNPTTRTISFSTEVHATLPPL